jgi:hypothetical protein
VTGPSTKCYFNKFLFMPILTYGKRKVNKSTVVNIRSAIASPFYVRPTSKMWFFENSPSDHKTRSI